MSRTSHYRFSLAAVNVTDTIHSFTFAPHFPILVLCTHHTHNCTKHIFADAMGLFSDVVHFKDQNYDKLRAECRRSGQLFEDEAFPANQRSLGEGPKFSNVEWKRPGVSLLLTEEGEMRSLTRHIKWIPLNVSVILHYARTRNNLGAHINVSYEPLWRIICIFKRCT